MITQNLPNLGQQLKQIEESERIQYRIGLGDARLALINALEQFRSSRYKLGKALSEYKAFFRASRAWMDVAQAIGHIFGCNERTIRRIVDDYERVSGVPAAVIKALEQAGIDPAARRNATIIDRILRAPQRDLLGGIDGCLLQPAAVRPE